LDLPSPRIWDCFTLKRSRAILKNLFIFIVKIEYLCWFEESLRLFILCFSPNHTKLMLEQNPVKHIIANGRNPNRED
jgi:hypothetical protein